MLLPSCASRKPSLSAANLALTASMFCLHRLCRRKSHGEWIPFGFQKLMHVGRCFKFARGGGGVVHKDCSARHVQRNWYCVCGNVDGLSLLNRLSLTVTPAYCHLVGSINEWVSQSPNHRPSWISKIYTWPLDWSVYAVAAVTIGIFFSASYAPELDWETFQKQPLKLRGTNWIQERKCWHKIWVRSAL